MHEFFEKAFPERVRIAREAIAKQNDALKARDPFGGALDDIPGTSKTVNHQFADGDRVRVNSSGHHAHGHAGVITDATNDNRLAVRLDSGHEIHCSHGDLVPENFPDPVDEIVRVLKSGGTVTLPARIRKKLESHPNLKKLIDADRIRFQEMMFT
jgi:hypothetical protein